MGGARRGARESEPKAVGNPPATASVCVAVVDTGTVDPAAGIRADAVCRLARCIVDAEALGLKSQPCKASLGGIHESCAASAGLSNGLFQF